MFRVILSFSVSALVLLSLLTQINAAKLGDRCSLDIRCAHELWCDPSPGQCGTAARGGACVRVKQLCLQLTRPVCGCNGNTYANDCQRIRSRVAKSHDGKC